MTKVKKVKRFPCECGNSYNTAKEFSDHVHTNCKEGLVSFPQNDEQIRSN